MRLVLTVVIVMIAFAGNSILSRLGVFHYGMEALSFALVRVAAGAVTLAALVAARGGRMRFAGAARWGGVVSLTLYLLGFSWAYITLDAGLGALILFGVVQLVMFGWVALRGAPPAALAWVGAGIAFAGLVLLLWPAGAVRVDPVGATWMAVAGAAWGAYSLLGRGEGDPTAATAANFVGAVPLVAAALFLASGWAWTTGGLVTAILSGAVTSGLGYALWYSVLPQIRASVAAVAQLSVPVIAVAAGVVLLGEPMSLRLVLAGALVLGGIAVSLRAR